MLRPKKLTLKQALIVTGKPLVRFGDLICVQVNSQMTTPPDFPNGEMKSIFVGGYDWLANRVLMEFPKPSTEKYLDELYVLGGRIETIAKFSDEELALYYDYKAGVITASGFAGDAGDSSQFEADCKEAFAGRYPGTSSYETAEIVRKTVLCAHKKYKLNANLGVKSSAAHSKSGSNSRNRELTQATRKMIAKEYWNRKGEYGAVKDLASRHDVSRQTIVNIANDFSTTELPK